MKIIIPSIMAIMLVIPAMADPQQIGMGSNVAIAPDAETADCDHDVLATYTGPTDMEANWTANTITLHWYNDNTEIDTTGTTSATCTYDGSITLPATNPTKPGYTFIGWQVKQPIQLEDCDKDAETCEQCKELFPGQFNDWGTPLPGWERVNNGGEECCIPGQPCVG